MNQKAVTIGFLVVTVITLLSFVLIAGSIYRLASKSDDKTAEALCKNSVALRAATAVQVVNTEAKAAPLLCKTLDAKISGKSAGDVETQIADKMARCWNMFGEGRYKTSVFENTNIFGGESKCFVCYTLAIDEIDGFDESTTISEQEFSQFLREKEYPPQKKTYLDYIQYGGGNGFVLQAVPEGIKANRAYAVAYKAKSTKCSWCGTLGLGGSASAAVGAGSIAVFGVGTGGVGLVILGLGAVAVSVTGELRDIFGNAADIDGIMLVDMNHEVISKAFTDGCELVPDIAGK